MEKRIKRWFKEEPFTDRYGQKTYRTFIQTQNYGLLLGLLNEFHITDRRGYDLAGYGSCIPDKIIVEWVEGDVYLRQFETTEEFEKALQREQAWADEQL